MGKPNPEPVEAWMVYHKGVAICARTSEIQAKCYASGFSDSSQVEIKKGTFTPDSVNPEPSPESTVDDSWPMILREHELILFWRGAWARADRNRRSPYLQVTQEYIHLRWNLANRRMKRLMDRVDRFRAKYPELIP